MAGRKQKGKDFPAVPFPAAVIRTRDAEMGVPERRPLIFFTPRGEKEIGVDSPPALKFKTGRIGRARLPPSLMGQGLAWVTTRQEARPPNFFTPSLGSEVAAEGFTTNQRKLQHYPDGIPVSTASPPQLSSGHFLFRLCVRFFPRINGLLGPMGRAAFEGQVDGQGVSIGREASCFVHFHRP